MDEHMVGEDSLEKEGLAMASVMHPAPLCNPQQQQAPLTEQTEQTESSTSHFGSDRQPVLQQGQLRFLPSAATQVADFGCRPMME